MTGTPPNIEWTGERCVPWANDTQVIYEHYSRYLWAAEHVTGKRVLDLACGEGYGAFLLAGRAARVVGIDNDEATIEHAQAVYSGKKVEFRLGSMTDSHVIERDTFDVVTCFEAIEHVADHDSVLRVAKAALTPKGMLFISTPDADVYSGEQHQNNPFHVRELNHRDFMNLLTKHFKYVESWGQSAVVGAVIGGVAAERTKVVGLDKVGRGWDVAPAQRHTYVVAVASDEPFDRSSIPCVLLYDAGFRLVRDSIRRYEDAREKLEKEQTAALTLRAESERQNADLAAATVANEELKCRLQATQEVVASAHDRLEIYQGAIKDLEISLSEAKSQLAVYESAITFGVATRMGRAVDRLLPPGSLRRRWLAREARRAFAARRNSSKRRPWPTAAATSDALVDFPRRIPRDRDPSVSIIIPVHGHADLTARCLRSIAESPLRTSFEVVVVDDASPDDSPLRLEAVSGLVLTKLANNVGYVRACNKGAAAASGRHLLFLNNDTEVRPGWLDAMYECLTSSDNVGIVGARLVYPNGQLQEAGGIIFNDATGWNFGRFDDPERACYLSRRDVDYVSGAALLVRGDVFRRIGGFDEMYSPAYYEDTDLAFAVRRNGMRVVYEPRAVVVHHEGASHGTDPTAGVKAFQELNREKFRQKWSSDLAKQPPARHATENVAAAAIHGRPPRLLIIDHMVPRPDQDSGSRRMWNLMRVFQDLGFAVTIIPDNGAGLEPYTGNLRSHGIEVITGPADQALKQIEFHPALVVLCRLDFAEMWLPRVRTAFPRVPIIFDTVDLHYLRASRLAELTGRTADARMADVVRRRELKLIRSVDATLVVSPTEAQILRRELPQCPVFTVSNIEEPGELGGSFADRRDLVFVGSFLHPPNLEAAQWLVTNVVPLVAERLPDAVFNLVGSGPTGPLDSLSSDRVRIVGWAPELASVYATTRVALAPLRYGAGVKGKVGDALRHGLPMVATTVAVEGMGLEDGKDILVADSAEKYADAIVRLYSDRTLWEALRRSGYETVIRNFSTVRARSALQQTLAGVLRPC